MSRVFVSHSSRDKDFVRRLAADLRDLGHTPWLDEWEIRVGDCIVTRIEAAISEADFIALVLSPNSVSSGWVEREWKSKYWGEIERHETLVLPLLIEDCDIPVLLRTKKYADFRRSYPVGLSQLAVSLNPIPPHVIAPLATARQDIHSQLAGLLARLQSRAVPLSQCIAEALQAGHDLGDGGLEEWCRRELVGFYSSDDVPEEGDRAHYRIIDVFVSFTARINMNYIGWDRSADNILAYLRDSKDFFPSRMHIPAAVASIESSAMLRPNDGLGFIEVTHASVAKTSPTPDAPAYVYCKGDAYQHVLEGIRGELTRRLVGLLPPPGSG